MTVSAKFPPLEINILEKILVELKIANKKGSIGMFFVCLAIFSCTRQIFGGQNIKSTNMKNVPVQVVPLSQKEAIPTVFGGFRSHVLSPKFGQ